MIIEQIEEALRKDKTVFISPLSYSELTVLVQHFSLPEYIVTAESLNHSYTQYSVRIQRLEK